jgi:hypothetical protein
MGNIPHKDISDSLHIELCNALADLAESAKIAMKRAALRAELIATIDQAAKVTRAAEAFRVAAHSMDTAEQDEAGLVPYCVGNLADPTDTWARAFRQVSVEGCIEQKLAQPPEEGATPILALYDQLGGFIKH